MKEIWKYVAVRKRQIKLEIILLHFRAYRCLPVCRRSLDADRNDSAKPMTKIKSFWLALMWPDAPLRPKTHNVPLLSPPSVHQELLHLIAYTSNQPICDWIRPIEYIKGIILTVANPVIAWAGFSHLTLANKRAMSAPTTMSDPPVAQAGILAKIGAKKINRKKNSATKTDVRPVRLPTSIPAALSMYKVMGERPKSN